jgi:predicted AAA+ superfamily ATPase
MIRRHVEPAILAGLADSPVVLLVGARQTGKSTLIQSAAFQKDRRYFTLDDTGVLAAIQADPAGFLHTYPEPLVQRGVSS